MLPLLRLQIQSCSPKLWLKNGAMVSTGLVALIWVLTGCISSVVNKLVYFLLLPLMNG